MNSLRLYTSSPASIKLADLGLTGTLARTVQLLPLTALPAPHPQRLHSLAAERDELQHDLAVIAWQLEQFANGRFVPDAGREYGLKADQDALTSRLRAVVATLGAQGGGQGHE